MSNPLVSIIVPTYKRTSYLALILESIKHQTFQDFEILVVDDGTPNDENLNLCQQIEKVKYIKIENSGGPAKPRNVGIRAARGKYLAFVDDDDIWLPNKLEIQVNILESNPSFGLVHGCCEVISEEGVLQNRIIGRPGSTEVKHGHVPLKMVGNWTVMMPTSFVRKDVVDKVGFFNEMMPAAGEDTEFWVRCSFEADFYYYDTPLVYYRVHSKNISTDKRSYLFLPLYLKGVCDEYFKLKYFTKEEYRQMVTSLCRSQIKTIKSGYFKTFRNLFLLDSYWMFRKNMTKMLIYVLFFKK